MKSAYKLGREHCKKGYSIYYNPFRHKGSPKDYVAWEKGWKDEKNKKERA